MNSVTTLPKLTGQRVLIRVDYNVPFIKSGRGVRIADPRRIEASIPTIEVVLKKGGTPLLLAHLGDSTQSLRPIATYLAKRFPIVCIDHDLTDTVGIEGLLHQIKPGTVVLFENIRRYPGEEANTASFAKKLAKLGSYYVNDAFSVSHRKHASIVGIPTYLPAYAGIQLMQEVGALAPVVAHPVHPFVFILGGAKFATKIPLITRFVDVADQVIIAGALLNSFYKTLGFEVGKSVVEDGYEKQIKMLMKRTNLLLPVDVTVLRAGTKIVCTAEEIKAEDVVVDIGPQSVALIQQKIAKAKLVVWNGPTGWYEKGFTKATTDIAKSIAQSKARAVIGGGDTGVVVEKVLKGTHKNIFISTGGGATIDFLSTGTLSGIQILG